MPGLLKLRGEGGAHIEKIGSNAPCNVHTKFVTRVFGKTPFGYPDLGARGKWASRHGRRCGPGTGHGQKPPFIK